MSNYEAPPPDCEQCPDAPALKQRIQARARDLGGFSVRRILPSPALRSVGPFVFVDHIGPADLPPGQGLDVRPHPHIGLATVTYLFDGEIDHRDSLGTHQLIRPGAINWMTAGRGIVHSERTREETRARGYRLHGMQVWVGLPRSQEEIAPAFFHHPADELPALQREGVRLRVLLGEAYGASSPVQIYSPTFYVDADMPGSSELPVALEHAERAVYVAQGTARIGGESFDAGAMAVLNEAADVNVTAGAEGARVVVLGGEPLDGRRTVWWNFVSSDKTRIEEAKRRWREGEFPPVPGDDAYIPLPE